MKMIMIEFQERQKWKPGFCVVEIVCVMINLTKDNINVRPSKKTNKADSENVDGVTIKSRR